MQLYAPMNYLGLLIFEALLKYENKRSISISDLEKCQEHLLMDIIDDCAEGNVPYEYANQDIIIDVEEDYSINDFLDKYYDYFTRDGDIISLDDNIEYEELDELIDEVEIDEEIEMLFVRVLDSFTSAFNLLGIHSIFDKLYSYLKVEEKLEEEYLNGCRNTNKMTALMATRELFYNYLSSLKSWEKEAYNDIGHKINFDYLSEPENEYSKSPLDERLWKRTVFATSDEIVDIEDRIYSVDFYAVFGKGSSTSNKLAYDLEHICLFGNHYQTQKKEVLHLSLTLDEDDPIQNIYEDSSYELVYFYLTFINKIDEYLLKRGPDKNIIELRKRILYAIDRPDLCLYKKDNLSKALKSVRENPINYEYDFIVNEIDFMSDEIFASNNKEYITKKLLLISTFYSLTNNEIIKLNLLDHLDYKYFDEYYNFIVGEEYIRGDDKKLTK